MPSPAHFAGPTPRTAATSRGSAASSAGDAAEARDELVRDVERAAPRGAGAQQQRDELGVGERRGAAREQALARLLTQDLLRPSRNPTALPAMSGRARGGAPHGEYRFASPSLELRHRDEAPPVAAIRRILAALIRLQRYTHTDAGGRLRATKYSRFSSRNPTPASGSSSRRCRGRRSGSTRRDT